MNAPAEAKRMKQMTYSKSGRLESAKTLIEYFVAERGAIVFTVETATDNKPSCRSLEKLGFVLVSTETVSFDEGFSFQGVTFVLSF